MADPRPAELQAAPAPATDENETPLVEAGREADDPGGAHIKGYTADPPANPAGTHAGAKPAYPLAPDRSDRG
jgi:hypothetical protein